MDRNANTHPNTRPNTRPNTSPRPPPPYYAQYSTNAALYPPLNAPLPPPVPTQTKEAPKHQPKRRHLPRLPKVETEEEIAKWIEERRKKYPRPHTPQVAPEDDTTRQPCKYFKGGKCRNGSECKFLHTVPVKPPSLLQSLDRPGDHLHQILKIMRFLRTRNFVID